MCLLSMVSSHSWLTSHRHVLWSAEGGMAKEISNSTAPCRDLIAGLCGRMVTTMYVRSYS
jgi:hypothetical protein